MTDGAATTVDPPGLVPDANVQVAHDVVCRACGCCCDDLTIAVRDGRIDRIEAHGCQLATDWFGRARDRLTQRPMTSGGSSVTYEEALDQIAGALVRAGRIVFRGLEEATLEAQAEALALADRLGAVVDGPPGDRDRTDVLRRHGRVSATRGEIRHRADLVMYWRVDPLTSHPNHFEHQVINPAGRFVTEGRRGRTLILLDDRETNQTRSAVDSVIEVGAETELDVLWSLRARLRGIDLGSDNRTLDPLIERLRVCRYGAWIYEGSTVDPLALQAITLLVRDLNASTRFVMVDLGGPTNAAGLESTLCAQAGFPAPIDLGSGHPEPMAGGGTVDVDHTYADVVLWCLGEIEDSNVSTFQNLVKDYPETNWILIGRGVERLAGPGRITLESTTPGWDESGSWVRSDGVTLPLRALVHRARRSSREIFADLHRRICER